MSTMNIFKQTFKYGQYEVTLETGGIARQADGAVMVRIKDTVVLVTAVAKKEAREGANFFPLTVNYQEKMYAAGRIPGGFLRREGRPADSETLTARLIDRPIRPLFPKGFVNEVQVIATVMSLDPEVQPDIAALLGASAALALSGAPFAGPIGAARVGYIDNKYVLNPSRDQVTQSDLDLVVAGTQDAVLMVESEANCLTEETMLGAVMYGHEQMQVAIKAINDLTAQAGKAKWEWQAAPENETLMTQVKAIAQDKIIAAYQVQEKQARYQQLDIIQSELKEQLCGENSEHSTDDVITLFGKLEKQYVRQNIINGELRIDGRDTRTVRPIRIENGILPRPHGSAIFTRGETQAIVVTTLGSDNNAQIMDEIHGERRDRFMLHYNFPPYCVGETGMVGSPKRREIGHGNLARRALAAVLPTQDAFPYTLRIVSEITESNGSSSMATVCGSSLSMMDAGVPLKAPVAGVAMGLIKEGDQFAVLTDILGDEDHLGDMDFKVAGTGTGVTALQMDIKITGITKAIMEAALAQAKEARIHILGLMNEVIDQPNALSAHAPRMTTIKVKPEKIKEIIGKGGATIKKITEETGVNIDLSDDGTVQIFATSNEATDQTVAMIEEIVADAEIGQVYEGAVSRVEEYGAFVNFLGSKQGLVHISQIHHDGVDKVTDHLNLGDVVKVKVIDIDRQGRVKLSIKALNETPAPAGDEQAAASTSTKTEQTLTATDVEASADAKTDEKEQDTKAKPRANNSRARTRSSAARKPATTDTTTE